MMAPHQNTDSHPCTPAPRTCSAHTFSKHILLFSWNSRVSVRGSNCSHFTHAQNVAFQKFWTGRLASPEAVEGDFQSLLGSAGSAELIHEATVYRGLHGGRHGGGGGGCKEVQDIIALLGSDTGVELIIVGHTPADSIRLTCKGQFAAVDSSLSRYFRAYG